MKIHFRISDRRANSNISQLTQIKYLLVIDNNFYFLWANNKSISKNNCLNSFPSSNTYRSPLLPSGSITIVSPWNNSVKKCLKIMDTRYQMIRCWHYSSYLEKALPLLPNRCFSNSICGFTRENRSVENQIKKHFQSKNNQIKACSKTYLKQLQK